MGIQEDIKELKELVEEKTKKKDKKFRYPFGSKVGNAQKKKNYVTILKLNENSKAEFKKVQIKDQTFMEDDIPRLAAAGYVFQEGRKNNPLVILPSWSVEPFSPLEHYNQSLINGTNTVGFRLLFSAMKLANVENKKQIGGLFKWIIGLGLAGIIAYAFLTGGG